MNRRSLMANLFAATCLFAFAATLSAGTSDVGRDVSSDEASSVQGSACATLSTTASDWCAIECNPWTLCASNRCAACGCLTTADMGGSGTSSDVTNTPCGVSGCGYRPFFYGYCTGS